jgi:hypothetical protein
MPLNPDNPRKFYTPEEDAYLHIHYPTHMPVLDIAAHFGRTEKTVHGRARWLGLKRPAVKYSAMGEEILRMAARSQGVCRNEVQGFGLHVVGCKLAKMHKAGQLFRQVNAYRDVRYFTTPEAVASYVKPVKQKPNAPSVTIKAGPKFDHDAPMIFTANTKYTIAPPPPERVYRTNTHSQL